MLAKQEGVLSGIDVAQEVFRTVDPSLDFSTLKRNGDHVHDREDIAVVKGNARSILTAERTALNFVQRLSGVATITAQYVAAVSGSSTAIVDTRKTTPGMRLLQKRAVMHGGGRNHRFGLADGVLIKDNHLAAIGGPNRIADAVAAAKARAPHTLRIEVEVTSLAELHEALEAGADIVLLDNMHTATMAEAIAIRNASGKQAILEASGGITLERLPELAGIGIDLVSVGALTHSAPSLDISLDIRLD
jgi:nicotinate-nucleotide pyrophosphorylase (carboxylating)